MKPDTALENDEGLERVAACDLCGGIRFKPLFEKPDFYSESDFIWKMVMCRGCGLAFLNPRPSPDAMSRYYHETYHGGRDTGYFQTRYKKQMNFLPPFGGANVLDIGCAKGDFLAAMKAKEQYVNCYGNDPYCDGVNHAFISFARQPLHEAGYAADFFSVVTAWASFEHLYQPAVYFREVGRILKPGGRFIMLVPNINSLYGRTAYREDLPRHLYGFSPQTLKRYGQQSGMTLRKVHFNDDIYDGRGVGTFKYQLSLAAGMTLREAHIGKPKRWIQRRAFKLGVLLDKLVFSRHWERHLKCSGTIIADFEKPLSNLR